MPLTPSQENAVKSAHEPLFIQAGAGTGKTFTLTKRLAYGLSKESGPLIGGVDRLLTITFTNKAAGELIGRVRAELRERGLAQEALQVDAAWISTIHAMCKRMLYAHAFDVGVDPGANLLSEDETAGLSAIAFDELLQDAAHDERLEMLCDSFGVEEASHLVLQLSSLLDLAPGGMADFDLGPAPGKPSMLPVQRVLHVYERAMAQLEDEGIPEGKKTYAENHLRLSRTIEGLTTWAVQEHSALSWQDLANALALYKPLLGGSFKEPYKGIFAECKGELAQAQAETACAVAYEQLMAAFELASEHVTRHRALKRAKGALDTNDLLIGAYRMLVQNPEFAAQYRSQFDSIMVDEFQDTDALQVGIVTHLCESGLSTLATVGDAQQSIYGFRGADLEVYRGVREKMRKQGSCEVELTTNYRSHADILRFVEDIFSKREFFGDEFLKVSSGREGALQPKWLDPDEPRVKVLLSAGSKNPAGRGHTRVGDLRWADARAVADEFERLHEQGAPYGDMAILLQSTKSTKAGAYLSELRRRGIPCVVSGGSDFFTLPEVSTLVMLLRVLANRDDDEALFDLLGSAVFDVSDDDLVALSVANKQKLKIAPEQARSKPSLFDALCYCTREDCQEKRMALEHTKNVLEHALQAAQQMPLSKVVHQVVECSGWAAGLRARKTEGGAVYANIERFCDMLDEYEQINGRSLYQVSEYFRNMVELAIEGRGARAKLGSLVSRGNEAVQIMTIHSSKGLEFPIVAVAEFEKSAHGRGSEALELTEDGKRYVSMSVASSTPIGKTIAEGVSDPASFSHAHSQAQFRLHANILQADREAQEQQRLLYVALTRARDMLLFLVHDSTFVSAHEMGKGLAGDCLRAAFNDEVPTSNAFIRTQAGALVDFRVTEVPYAAEADDEETVLHDVPVTEHLYPYLEEIPHIYSYEQTGSQIFSYSSIAARNASLEQPVAAAMALRDRSKDAETASAVGSAFHLVAQWIIESKKTDVASLAARIQNAGRRYKLDSKQQETLLRAIDVWVNSPRFAQVMAIERTFAEYPFCVDVHGYKLEGFIDLLCLDDSGRALVIDYKTGTSGQGEDLHERYSLQAHCYAYALLSSGVCDVVELVFVRPEMNMEEIAFSFSREDIETLAQSIL